MLAMLVAPRGLVGSVAALLPRRRSEDDAAAPRAEVLRFIAPAAPAPLTVEGLGITFGGLRAVSGAGFTVAPGEVTAIIGPNGAGKTTLLNLISGFYAPDSGGIETAGRQIAGWPMHAAARLGIARTYQATRLFGTLSAEANVVAGFAKGGLGIPFTSSATAERHAMTRGLLALLGYAGDPTAPAADLPHVDRLLVEIARALAMRPHVLLLDSPAGPLSGGEQQLMAIARGLMAKPELLLLDDPFLGLAPTMIEELYAILAELRGDGMTILLVDQMATLALAVDDQGYVLEQGRIAAEGTAAGLQDDRALVDAYLGQGAEQAEAAQ
ncbi:ABC transporter ATP-binding protein [Salipiger thiooxidans]|uniref:ABC transporter ATP-binding protein n=1 Tax=Salipiger thiooxidans TaxID=282683 RepID=UPI001CD567B6|nr:ATP-binding cassette domain-containing protein [Salipiger thiooxidans]MCA0845933.1 ATP-binding cassette domain-containing protein [Salipiger thiooxidans]